jgi:hypothetical protein
VVTGWPLTSLPTLTEMRKTQTQLFKIVCYFFQLTQQKKFYFPLNQDKTCINKAIEFGTRSDKVDQPSLLIRRIIAANKHKIVDDIATHLKAMVAFFERHGSVCGEFGVRYGFEDMALLNQR